MLINLPDNQEQSYFESSQIISSLTELLTCYANFPFLNDALLTISQMIHKQ